MTIELHPSLHLQLDANGKQGYTVNVLLYSVQAPNYLLKRTGAIS